MRKVSVVRDLIEIKEMIGNGHANERNEDSDLVLRKLEAISNKIDKINNINNITKKETFIDESQESPVKTKRKAGIIRLLGDKKLTSAELSALTGISRTRSNEYLRELEKDGIARGIINNKKKFYRLVKWEKSLE